MSPVTHLLIGWLVAQAPRGIGRRERALITLAGVVPDLDGLGIVAEVLTRNTEAPLLWWSEYHHVLLHNLWGGLIFAALAGGLARVARGPVVVATFVSFHLHLLGDLVGSRGPDGYVWPIPWLAPISSALTFTWAGQWALNAWQNLVITVLALGVAGYLAWRRGVSVVEVFSVSADRQVVAALRARWGGPPGGA